MHEHHTRCQEGRKWNGVPSGFMMWVLAILFVPGKHDRMQEVATDTIAKKTAPSVQRIRDEVT